MVKVPQIEPLAGMTPLGMKKKEAHTPGPWNVFGTTIWAGKNQASANNIAIISTEPDVRNEFQANARLIAAAPEMLAELEGYNNLMAAYESGEITLEQLNYRLTEHYKTCRAADKARGK